MNAVPCLVVPLALVTQVLAAQTDASVGLGGGTVRYTGGTAFSSAGLSSAAEVDAPTRTVSGAASLASLPGGIWSLQGRGDAWVASARFGRGLQVAGEAIFAGARRGDGPWSAAAHVVGEVLWSKPAWGLGAGGGPSAGWIQAEPSVTGLHLRLRGWKQAGPLYASFAIEPTHFLGAWFTDVGTGVSWTHGSVTGSLWAQTRLSAAYGSTAAASVAVQAYVSPLVSLELGGGNVLRDPYQGLPRAGYVTFGARIHARRHSTRNVAPAVPPLIPATRGDSLVVRFHMAGARTVAIAGDWNAWKPAPLRPIAGEIWEGALTLRPGVYHFNLLVDGKEWVVPNGVATVADGLGGMVGVIAVQ